MKHGPASGCSVCSGKKKGKHLAVSAAEKLRGKLSLPGDKSIAHRAIIISSLSSGSTTIRNFPFSQDCLATLEIFKKLGVRISAGKNELRVAGRGLFGLKKPSLPLRVEESGTTLRLLLGVLAGQDFEARVLAGPALSGRPMARVTVPLRLMGARIHARKGRLSAKRHPLNANEEYPPITIRGNPHLKGMRYKMPVASAQVKSAILLAGLYCDAETKIIEEVQSRDHTERMLKLFGADIRIKKRLITLEGGSGLVSPGNIIIPGDISSAAFFMVAASIVAGSLITIKNVSLNPLRCGALNVMKRMGADIKVTKTPRHQVTGFEPSGDIVVKSAALRGVVIKEAEIPSLIDEVPVLMVAACFARGRTVFRGAGELRVKETDRINSMARNLNSMGAQVSIESSGSGENIIVKGQDKRLTGCRVRSFGDHRTAMSLIVAGLGAKGRTVIDDVSCIAKSFPGFIGALKRIRD